MAISPFHFPCARCVWLALLVAGGSGTGSEAQTGSDWPQYRGDLAGTGFSSLTQITTDNVAGLVPAWEYSLASSPDSGRVAQSQATPIVLNNVMYLPAADRVVALDPASGLELWRHVLSDGSPSRRGVAYWPGDGNLNPRIYFTSGASLIAVDAASGAPSAGFGSDGSIDIGVPYNSVPLVFENIVVVGANTPPGAIGGIGNARAFDAVSGAALWEFSSVPQPGEPGHDTWAGDSWRDRLGANAWPFYFTVDPERGHLYLPLASPIPFAYGGDRAGTNLYANSLVAVDIRTGDYRWHFQTIHHDLWDHDPPAPPTLFDIPRNGDDIPALGLTTKSGYLFILNRDTGEPVFGVEERPVPQSLVPGEQTWPTQPIPLKPPALARVSYAATDLVTAEDTSPEHAAACTELLEQVGPIVNDGPYTPWVYRAPGSVPQTTLLFPGLAGGPNWGGVAVNPDSGLAYVFSADIGSFGWMEDAAAASVWPYERSGPRPGNFDVAVGGMRLPCQKPPWGQLTAVNINTGDIAWQQPLGLTESLPPGRQLTGRPGRAGAIATAGNLLFIGATDDNRIRALNARTGATLWEHTLKGRGNANPLTYMGSDGRQYIVISATDTVQAFRLP